MSENGDRSWSSIDPNGAALSWTQEELEQLLNDCAKGDPLAWRRLLEAVRRLALGRALRTYRLGPDDAEDLAQQVQIRVSERLPQLRRHAAFPVWVTRLIHHVALDLLRQRRPLLSLDALPGPETSLRRAWLGATGEEVPDLYEQALMRALLDDALVRLPVLYREPIRLHLLDGMPQEQVAHRLGRPRSTVATQIERGLRRLRRLLWGLSAGENEGGKENQ
jgi:RNA polymerase sigma factor (sigma-70 family)